MIKKINTAILAIALSLLFGSGLILALGHSPEQQSYNERAERLATIAYGLLVLGWLGRVAELLWQKDDHGT